MFCTICYCEHDSSYGVDACIANLRAFLNVYKRDLASMKKLLSDLYEIVETGPCCGSTDESTSHYHCGNCGKVGGMFVCCESTIGLDGKLVSAPKKCKPDPENEYIKRQAILSRVGEVVGDPE